MRILIYVMIYLGSGLMVYNIARYAVFIRNAKDAGEWGKGKTRLYTPLVLLILFLAGYLSVAWFGKPDIIMAAILFGGSIFVFLVVGLMSYILRRIRESELQMEAHFGELKENLDYLTKDSLSVFQVDLTRDIVEERAGGDLYDSDRTATSYSELLEKRWDSLLVKPRAGNGPSPFSREGLIARYNSGHRAVSEVVFCRRPSGRQCFVKMHAALAVQPVTGDIVAFLTEQDFNDEMVNDAMLHKALAEQYDMISYIVDGHYGVVIGDAAKVKKGNIFPHSREGAYLDYLNGQVLPAVAGSEAERAAAADALSLERVRRELADDDPYVADITCQVDGETYYKRFVFYVVDRSADFYILLKSDTTEVQKEQIARNEQLENALEEAERASDAKTVFLSNMSHDIRTPMNAIIGYANLARRDGVTESEMRGYLDKIGSSSQHLLALINDVLEMSRIESGRLELELARTDLCGVLAEARDMFAAQMASKNIDYTVDASQVRDPNVLCDKNRLNRVLLNLISNACKFTPEGGRVSVTLLQTGGTETEGEYELRVRDSGIGMSPEFAAHVFEAFERERTSTVSGIQGTGLGMAITKSIVDLMGGTIEVETSPGQGSEFIVRVHFAIAEGQTDAEAAQGKPREGLAPDFGKKHLLLVEDNEINREIAEMILRDAGFSLDTAENGQIAVKKVKASRPGQYDAVLMDIQMPVLNGYEAARAIRALDDPALAGIPIIAMTANAFREDIQAAEEAGMNAHIAKPLDVQKMMDTLADVLR